MGLDLLGLKSLSSNLRRTIIHRIINIHQGFIGVRSKRDKKFIAYFQVVNTSNILHYQTLSAHIGATSAEWVVLIHGAGGSINTWKKQIDDLQMHFNLLLVDLPGHGMSALNSVKEKVYTFDYIGRKVWEVIDHLKLERVHLTSISIGTIVAQQMLIMRPNRVLSMVMGGAVTRLNIPVKLVASMGLFLSKFIGYPNFYRLMARMVLPKNNHKKSRDIFIRESRKLTDEEFKKWTAMYGDYLDKTLKTFQKYVAEIPLYLVMGEQDHFFLREARKFVAKKTNAKLEVIKQCGHVVSLERASEFNKASINFMLNVTRDTRAKLTKRFKN